MRRVFTAAALILGAAMAVSPATALDIEEQVRMGPDPAAATLRILSTTDYAAARHFLLDFLAATPDVAVDYVVASTRSVQHAIAEEGMAFDVVISSAMDLQMQLANDGHAAPIPALVAIPGLPRWAHWRDLVFGLSLEPVVIVASASAFAPGQFPKTRRELIDRLREDPERYRGRIGTYDPAVSGAGYLFATQDAAFGNTFWRLAEVLGRLDARLYCCSGEMIDDLANGRLLVAYNVVGSYAKARAIDDDRLVVIEPEDFTLLLQRTAIIPRTASNPALATLFLNFLLSPAGQDAIALAPGQMPVAGDAANELLFTRAIRLDPGLLANLDAIRKSSFLREWSAAMIQP